MDMLLASASRQATSLFAREHPAPGGDRDRKPIVSLDAAKLGFPARLGPAVACASASDVTAREKRGRWPARADGSDEEIG